MMQSMDRSFGQKVRMARLERGLSLRNLADLTQISKSLISDLELGQGVVSANMARSLVTVLDIAHQSDLGNVAEFKRQKTLLYDALTSGIDDVAQSAVNQLESQMDVWTRGPLFIEYYLVVLMYALLTERKTVVIEPYFQRLYSIRTLLTAPQKMEFLLLSAFYYLHVHDFDEAEKTLERLHHTSLTTLQRALSDFVRGKLYTYDYRRFKMALMVFEQAKETFMGLNNFFFVMQIKVSQQKIYIYRQSFERFWRLHEDTQSYAHIHQITTLEHANQGNLVRYYLIQGDYQSMIEILKQRDNLSHLDQFLNAYGHMRLGLVEAANWLLNGVENHTVSRFFEPLSRGVEALGHLLSVGADLKYQRKLKVFADSAYKQGHYVLIRVAHKLLSEQLQQHRKYKEALQYAERLLGIMWAMTGGI